MTRSLPALEIHLFGAPHVLLNGQPLDNLRRKNRALLYYLAAHSQALTRDHLLTFFWPDHERSAAQPILRTMLHDLRKHLGNTFQADTETIAFAPGSVIDIKIFSTVIESQASNSAKLAEALAFYRGDFLDGFSLTDSPQFEDWAAAERDRYRLLAMRGFAELARQHEGIRDYPVALEHLRRALAFNPFQEELQRDLMRLLYLNGDRAGLIHQYEALRKLLDEELGVPPMPETRTLYDALINETFVSSPVESSVPISHSVTSEATLPFIGRESELELLKRQLDSGKLILLEGEPGIGKTRLASELIASQSRSQQPSLVLRGVAYELEQGLPYQPMIDALRSLLNQAEWKSFASHPDLAPVWLTELARLLPELLTQYPHLPAPSQPADESRLWESLVQFIRALTRRQRVWLFLDDLHWADAATVGWLGYLTRHLSSPSFVLITTSRPIEAASHLARLVQSLKREDRIVHLQPSALSQSAMQQMAIALSPGYEDQLSAWMAENTEGNPFFLTELIRYAVEIGLLKTDGTLDTELFRTSPILPATIQNLVESRLLRLSEDARRILHLAAIIGREFDFELVHQTASLGESDALNAIEELQSAHLIQPLQDERFTFDHSLTMQVALQDMSAARRRALHRHVAEALESVYRLNLEPVSGLIARHFIDGGLLARAAPYAFRAGEFAANLAAWADAIAFHEQALTLEPDATQRILIHLALGTAHLHKGNFAQASISYRAAVDLAQMCGDWSLWEAAHLALNQSFLPQTRFAEAIRLAKELRESGPPELALCAELMWGTGLSVESAHPMEAEVHLNEALRLLQEHPGYSGQITLTRITYQLAAVVGQQGRSHEAIDLYRRALDMTEHGDGRLDILRNIMLYNDLAYHLHLVGDASAADYINAGIQLAREKGSLSHLPHLYSTSGEIALAAGDLDAAEKYWLDGLALAEQIPLPERIAGITANLGLVAKRRGHRQLARERLQTALLLAQQLENHHLEVRIRIWLTPLLPSEEARPCLESARVLAETNGLQGLLQEIVELENDLDSPS